MPELDSVTRTVPATSPLVLEELVADRAGTFHKESGSVVTVCPVSLPLMVSIDRYGRLNHDLNHLERLFSSYEQDPLPFRGYIAGNSFRRGLLSAPEIVVPITYVRYRMGILLPEYDRPEYYIGATMSVGPAESRRKQK